MFGQRVLAARKAAGLSQAEVAAHLASTRPATAPGNANPSPCAPTNWSAWPRFCAGPSNSCSALPTPKRAEVPWAKPGVYLKWCPACRGTGRTRSSKWWKPWWPKTRIRAKPPELILGAANHGEKGKRPAFFKERGQGKLERLRAKLDAGSFLPLTR